PRMFKIEKLSQPVEVTSSYRARNKSSLDRIRIGSEALFLEVDYNVNSLQELIEFDPDLIPIKEWPEIWIVKRNRGGRTFKVGRVGSEDGRSYLLHVCSKIIFQQSDFLERISSLWPDFAQAIRRAKENEKGFATLPAVSQKTLGFKKDIAFAFNRGGEGISRLHIVGTRLALGPLVRQFYEVLKSRGLESGELNLEEIIHSSSNRFLKSHFRLGDIDFHMRVAYANEPSVPHYLVIEWLDRKSKKQAELLLSELKAFKEATDH
ncbi:MAG: hypothetical protein KDD35_12835, partial [Bdellovibrionales bacterium]|nr:hypothetical protein [Bdellovibrionales bacterium]